MVIRVLNNRFHQRIGPVVGEYAVTRLQSLNRLWAVRSIHWSASGEAAHRLAALLLARVEERRGGRLEPAVDDLVDEMLGQTGVARGQRQRHHADPVLEPLQVSLAVEGFQRVGGVVLERAEEGREPEL